MEYNNLKKSVINQLGINDEEELKQTLSDISNNGADGGFNGFIYYDETCKFAKENIKDIFDYAQEQAEQLGEGVYKMISSFNCLNGMDVKETEVASTIHSTLNGVVDIDEGLVCQSMDTEILNALSWYALEEIARGEVDHYGV